MKNTPAKKAPSTAPVVLTAYSSPTLRPAGPFRAACRVSVGRVSPIKVAGQASTNSVSRICRPKLPPDATYTASTPRSTVGNASASAAISPSATP